MLYVDILGYIAGCLVLAAFCMPSIIPLRVLAILSNLAFIGYGYFKCVMPVLLLHAVLLPVNTYRLGQAVQAMRVTTEQVSSTDPTQKST